jgi:glycosyltransferase involved in cell wall biosynthesis
MENSAKKINLVSVIIPTMNEGKFIGKCLASLEDSDYPLEKMELIVIDGGSTDNTIHVVKTFQEKYGNINLIEESGANTSVGRNIAVKRAKGDIIFNFSSHATVEKETIHLLASKLVNSSAEVVAGVGCKDQIPSDQSSIIPVGIDSITNTFLGGTLMHQQAQLKEEGYLDSISFTVYRKSIFERIGYFNSQIPTGDDAEFNQRIKEAGYKLLFTPETCVYRYKREKVRSFFWQMFKYGRSRMQISRAHNNSIRIAYIIPLFYIGYIFALGILLFLGNMLLLVAWSLVALSYFLVLIGVSTQLSLRKKKANMLLICPFLFLIQHLSYSLGLFAGILSKKQALNKENSN